MDQQSLGPPRSSGYWFADSTQFQPEASMDCLMRNQRVRIFEKRTKKSKIFKEPHTLGKLHLQPEERIQIARAMKLDNSSTFIGPNVRRMRLRSI